LLENSIKGHVLINGASSGIGKALALNLSKNKIKIIAVSRSKDKLEELKKIDKEIKIFSADLSQETERINLYKWIKAKNFQIFSIVNSVGTVLPIKTASELLIKEWKKSLATNFEAPLFTTLLISSLMDFGRILFIGSSSSSKARKGWTPYCCSKSALKMAVDCLKIEWQEKKILLTTAKPGAVLTKIMKDGINADGNIFPDKTSFIEAINKGTYYEPEEVAKFLSWLLIECPDQEFLKLDWDISDNHHHKFWKNKDIN
jgi:short-subunit dehydrogenase|tara:strand:+ start:13 stop:789 length:777 start_codon:yes stop_codon:yes gene_type:complete